METRAPDTAQPTAPPPSAPAPDRAKFEQARRRVAAIKGFYIHLTVFVLVLAGLFAIDLATGSEWWVHWVLLGWGVGVIAHALAVFGRAPAMVAEWEARKVRQLLRQ
jgi:fatty acid desaturase